MNKTIERLVNFIKKYPKLWNEKGLDKNDEDSISKLVDSFMNEEQEVKDTREDLIIS